MKKVNKINKFLKSEFIKMITIIQQTKKENKVKPSCKNRLFLNNIKEILCIYQVLSNNCDL